MCAVAQANITRLLRSWSHGDKVATEQGNPVAYLDGDTAGRNSAEAIAERLVRKLHVRIVELADRQQPDHFLLRNWSRSSDGECSRFPVCCRENIPKRGNACALGG